MLTRAEYDAAMAAEASPELSPELIRELVAGRPEETLTERISAAMYLDLVVRQNRAVASPEGLDEAAHAERIELWTAETGAILADEAAAMFELGASPESHDV